MSTEAWHRAGKACIALALVLALFFAGEWSDDQWRAGNAQVVNLRAATAVPSSMAADQETVWVSFYGQFPPEECLEGTVRWMKPYWYSCATETGSLWFEERSVGPDAQLASCQSQLEDLNAQWWRMRDSVQLLEQSLRSAIHDNWLDYYGGQRR